MKISRKGFFTYLTGLMAGALSVQAKALSAVQAKGQPTYRSRRLVFYPNKWQYDPEADYFVQVATSSVEAIELYLKRKYDTDPGVSVFSLEHTSVFILNGRFGSLADGGFVAFVLDRTDPVLYTGDLSSIPTEIVASEDFISIVWPNGIPKRESWSRLPSPIEAEKLIAEFNQSFRT